MRLLRSLTILATLALALAAMGQNAARTVAMLDIPGSPGFNGVAMAKGMLLMSHSGASTVDIFDPQKRRVVGNVKGMSDPRGIAVNADGGEVYIANHDANNIVVLDTSDWHVKGTIAVSGSPTDVEYVPAWNTLVASDSVAQKLMFVDPRQRREMGTIPNVGTPGGMAFDATQGLLFVTLQNSREVIGLSRQFRIEKRFQLLASQPTGIVYDPQPNRLYVAVRYAVVTLDANTGRELSRVPAPAGIDQLSLDPDSRMLYGAAGGSLLVMRAGERLQVLDEVPTEVKGYLVAYDPERKMVYFPGAREGRSKLLLVQSPLATAPTEQNSEAKLH